MINELFDTLDNWRYLPAYQLERRADIFFALHLKDIFKATFNQNITDIIPEFPIRIGTIYPDIPINKSYKIDYAVFTEANRVYLVELKTDDGSTRDSQYTYYFKSIEIGFKQIVQGILLICDATFAKSKYQNLLQKLMANGSISVVGGLYKPTDKYTFYEKPVFIKPNTTGGDRGEVIDFTRIFKILKDKDNDLTKRFTESLLKWKEHVENQIVD